MPGLRSEEYQKQVDLEEYCMERHRARTGGRPLPRETTQKILLRERDAFNRKYGHGTSCGPCRCELSQSQTSQATAGEVEEATSIEGAQELILRGYSGG